MFTCETTIVFSEDFVCLQSSELLLFRGPPRDFFDTIIILSLRFVVMGLVNLYNYSCDECAGHFGQRHAEDSLIWTSHLQVLMVLLDYLYLLHCIIHPPNVRALIIFIVCKGSLIGNPWGEFVIIF